MVRGLSLRRLLGFGAHPSRDHHDSADRARTWASHEHQTLLPRYQRTSYESHFPADEVTKIALRLRRLIEQCVPCELEEAAVARAHSKIITPKVVQAAREAGSEQYRACVVYCLLVAKRWFRHQALSELWDSDLHRVRATACEVIAKQIIEAEQDTEHLLHAILLRRYSVLVDGRPTPPVNVIEMAVDMHALRVICSSGYQKCISQLWRGWLVQDENDPSMFVDYRDRDNRSFLVHMDPDRMRAPVYQNVAMVLISVAYLGLYTGVINAISPSGNLAAAEIFLYVFTLGFVCDEAVKVWKAGRHILGFWNAFNGTLYVLLTLSLVLRLVGLSHPVDDGERIRFNKLAYNFLAFAAPMFWGRLLLYLDSIRFFGAMLVVVKVMMKESLIFFALLAVIIVGFLQAFIGMDIADDSVADDAVFIISAMANSILQSPDFSGFDNFAPPFGIILYYLFTFIVMVVLLNVLIALYNSAYEDVYDNANDEFLALFAHKTMQYVRAPDENVYVAPLNLIEMVLIVLFGWWLPARRFEQLNDMAMALLYSPLLLAAAYAETRTAAEIQSNRRRGEADDDTIEEWEQLGAEVNFEADGWDKTCRAVAANVEEEAAVVEVRQLRGEVAELRGLLQEIIGTLGRGGGEQIGEEGGGVTGMRKRKSSSSSSSGGGDGDGGNSGD